MAKPSVNSFLHQLFISNEMEEDATKKLTDQKIVELIVRRFPATAINSESRVRRARYKYNKGVGKFWKRMGPAGDSRPLSNEYDVVGNIVQRERERMGRQRRGPSLDLEQIRALIREEVKKEQAPTIIIKHREKADVILPPGSVHVKFHEVMENVNAGLNVMLVGPSGSGKTVLATSVATALKRKLTFNSFSEGVTESSIFGRVLPDKTGAWVYQDAPFVRSYRDGGVHLFDEVDAADANLLVSINAALDNKMLSLPFADCDPIPQHPDNVIIMAGNTYGTGADRRYVGRNKMDAATIDRVLMGIVEVDYDRDLEQRVARAHCPDEDKSDQLGDLLRWAWQVRDRIMQSGLERIMSMRTIRNASNLLRVGVSLENIKARFFRGWRPDEKAKFGGGLIP